MRLPGEIRCRMGGVVHFDQVDIHEKGFVAIGMLLDIVDRLIGLSYIQGSHVVIVNRGGHFRRFARYAFPFAQVHDVIISL